MIKDWISNLADDMQEQVITFIKYNIHFALQLDKTTGMKTNSNLIAYVHYWDKDRIESQMSFCTLVKLQIGGIDALTISLKLLG